MSIELKEYQERLNLFLADTFQKHGVKCEIENNLVVFRKEHITAYTKIFDMSVSYSTLLQLDVILEFGLGKKIIESCVGGGIDIDSAIERVQGIFISNTFYVLLTAFFIPDNKKHISRHKWLIGQHRYDVIVSQINALGDIPNPLPMKWYEELEELIKNQEWSRGTHWLHLFYGQSAREIIRCEILLDNEVWKSEEKRFLSFDFPKSNDFLSISVFIVMQNALDISRAAQILSQITDKDLNKSIIELEKTGMSIAEAEKAAAFVPLAFNRVFLKERTSFIFSNEAIIVNNSGEEININLENEPIYVDAYELAEQVISKIEITPKQLENIISHSIEIDEYYQLQQQESVDSEHFTKKETKPLIISLPNYKKEMNSEKEYDNKKKKYPWMFWRK